MEGRVASNVATATVPDPKVGAVTRRLPRSASRIPRRTTLWRCLGLLGLCRRSAWAATAAQATGYRDLKSPVTVPLREVAEPWRPVPFDARASSLGPAGRDLLLRGVLLRTGEATGPASGLKALCLTCPHEICYVNFVEDTKAVRVEEAVKPDHPLFVCPCHFSVFDPVADGARLAGPSGRGLFRFRLQVDRDTVQIGQVEEDLLRFFA